MNNIIEKKNQIVLQKNIIFIYEIVKIMFNSLMNALPNNRKQKTIKVNLYYILFLL